MGEAGSSVTGSVIIYLFSLDGAELLLDLGLPAGIIGGIVLPLLGAVPDSAMIIFSGIGGSRDDANKQISVGMGLVFTVAIIPK